MQNDDLNITIGTLSERIDNLKEDFDKKEDRDLKIFEEIIKNQRILSERLLVVETNQQYLSEAVVKLQKESSLQTKLLTGILLAAVSSLVTIILKAVMG